MNNIWSSGDVEGVTSVGGLIGYNYSYHTNSTANITYIVTLNRSYASGNVIGKDNVGGLVRISTIGDKCIS
ncbi:hypothetical protein D3C72_2216400 [compost metagenome]